MNPTINPLRDVILDGVNIRNRLDTDTLQMRLALENRHFALQAHQSAKQAYQDAEAEFLADFTWADDAYRSAKNAEQREILKDAALVRSRQAGVLAYPWRALNDTRRELDNTELAYAQCEVSFKAVKTAAELTGALLKAASV